VLSSPYLSNDAADWLVEKQVKLVGLDTPMLDDPRVSVREERLPDKIFARHGIPYMCSLVNLGAISGTRFSFIALPIKIKDVSGAPIRAIAIEE
jgi:kynurenine formamidase